MTVTPLAPASVEARCPNCNAKLTALPAMQHAVSFVRRKCRHCNTRWHVKIYPSRLGKYNNWLTTVDWLAL